MAYEKISFSRGTLAAIDPAPEGKRAYFRDTKEPGLTLCVTSKGTKSFQVYMKRDGRPLRVTLGRFNPSLADGIEGPRDCPHGEFLANTPELNVRMARDLAAKVKIDLKAGLQPAEVKRAKRDELTLGQLFEKYHDDHLVAQKKKTAEQIRTDFQRYLGELPDQPRKKQGAVSTKAAGSVNWQNRPIGKITKHEVQKLHSDIGRLSGHRTANRATEMISAMYNQAIYWGLFNGGNPTSGVKKFRIKRRDRFLQADELPRFFVSLAQEENNDMRDYLLLTLLTGSRRGNVAELEWANVNLERAVATLPDTKNGDDIQIPLTAEAVEILRERKPSKPPRYVFPGRGKSGHMEDPKRGWKRLPDRDELAQLAARINDSGEGFTYPIERAKPQGNRGRKLESLTDSLERARQVAADTGIDTTETRLTNLRPHDLRRTLGSWQAATGASLAIIGKSLGHRSLASTQIYAHLSIEPVRDSVQRATDAMFAHGGGALPGATVTDIGEARAKKKIA